LSFMVAISLSVGLRFANSKPRITCSGIPASEAAPASHGLRLAIIEGRQGGLPVDMC
jgi:hypothetical protein